MNRSPEPAGERERTVQAFVRTASVVDPPDEKLRRLQHLDTRGVVDTLLVRAWPARVPLSAADVRTSVIENYERFAAWADREGKSIEPAFEVRRQSSTITGETREVLTTPMMCLAVYEGEVLRAVFPHADADGHHSVTDAIDALADGRFQPAVSDQPRVPRTHICSDCGADLVDAQGRLVCPDCGRVADHIDALSATEPGPTPDARPQVPDDACSACGTDLANAQGVLVCPDCGRVATTDTERLATRDWSDAAASRTR